MGRSNFCILLFADKSMWLPGIRQEGAVDTPADIFSLVLDAIWPRDHKQHYFMRVHAATSFDQGVKGRKTPRFPAPSGATPYGVPDGAEPVVRGHMFLLVRPECGKTSFSADTNGGHILPASAGLSPADRLQTEYPINIALQ